MDLNVLLHAWKETFHSEILHLLSTVDNIINTTTTTTTKNNNKQ